MAETAYERFLKDTTKDEAVEIDIKEQKPFDLEEVKFKIQQTLTEQTEPRKPVKWLSLPEPRSIMSLYYRLNPAKRLGDAIGMKQDPMTLVKQLPVKEKDYISGLDEIAKGLDSGLYDLQHSLNSLLFAGTDLIANTDFLSKFENIMAKEENLPERPETWRGELTSLATQFGIPGTTVAKIVSRIPLIAKMYRASSNIKGSVLRKTSKIATRATEGATIVGVTDFIASEKGRESLFFEPESTEGLTGKKKAAAEFRNRIKYGTEGTLVGGGFPIVGKFTQLGYKYGLAPFVRTGASLGAKTIDKTVFRPAEIILGSKIAKPITVNASKAIQNATNFTISKLMAPLLVSGMSRKIVTQLPPFEQWRLKSVTDPNPVNKSIKKLDNFLSFFRSYGKQPKDIEGVSEQVQLYIKSRARKIDRTYEGLEKTAYNLAKKFEDNYNTATTSRPMQKYFLDQLDEYAKGQIKLTDLPKELQPGAKDLVNDIQKIMAEFKKVLPKGKEADDLAKDLANIEIRDVKKYLVRSFETFRNPEFVPPKEAVDKGITYIVDKVIKKNTSLKESARLAFPKLKPESAYKESAKMHIEDILRTGKAEGKSPLKQLKEIGTRILLNDKYKFLKTGEELPDQIKNLLGPERNLKASVSYTTSEAIASMANKRAADYIAQSGLKNGWLFNNLEDAVNAGFIGAQKITKVPRLGVMNSNLLGKYASPEYVQMFQGVGNDLDKLVQMALYRHLLQAKVGVQIGKTLYSPQTQVRNVTSASFFSLMNGHIGNKASVTDAMRIVARDIFKAGQKGNIDEVEFNNYVEKLVRLGVWDENVVAAEMKSVLEDISKGVINTTDKLFDRLMKSAPTDKVARLYAGGDNLWKQYGWEYGKSQLSMALKSIDEVAEWFRYMGKEFDPVNTITGQKKTFDDAIEEASAFLLRNTYPTYSKVPPFIQNLRKVALVGNFISFPAEILRTGANIIATGLKEAAHPNAAIRQMGIRRLTGAALTSYAIGKGATQIAQFLTNSTESQWDAYKRSSAASWDATSNLLAIKGWKNGESAAINFSYFGPYDSLFQPLEAAIAQAQKQNLNPEETDQYVMNLMFGENGPVRKFLEPYFSEPIGFDRFIDVSIRNGKKDQGGSVYTRTDDLGDKFMKSFAYVLDGVQPGVTKSIEKIGSALSKDLSRGGKPVNLLDELLALFAGTRIIRIDVKKDLRYFTSTMNSLLREVDETENFYSVENFADKAPSDLVETFENMQDEAFRVQKDMYIRIKDLELLDLSKSQIYEIMRKQGTPRKLINNLMAGRFTPVNYSKARFENKVQLVKDQMKRLSEESDQFFYSANRSFLFPQRELDKVIANYSGKKFFEETFNEETREFEGGYSPDKTKYKTNSEGRLIFDSEGNPVKEPGFIERQLKKIPSLLKDITLPGGVPGFSSKPQAPPLGDTPMPKLMASANTKNAQTNLTRNEEALLSPSEKVIASRT
tara:strand:+ start:281 stop:4672 length:4392 start_codon:yes stop_codon:yes gene_type:complete